MPRLRPYRADDWSQFLELELATGLDSVARAGGDQADHDRFARTWPEVLRERCAWTDAGPTRDRSALWVLEHDDGEYIGHVWVADREDLLRGSIQLWITAVAVAPKHRGRGYGRMLVEHAIAEGRRRGAGSVGLAVDVGNAIARALYERLGFVDERTTMTIRLTK